MHAHTDTCNCNSKTFFFFLWWSYHSLVAIHFTANLTFIWFFYIGQWRTDCKLEGKRKRIGSEHDAGWTTAQQLYHSSETIQNFDLQTYLFETDHSFSLSAVAWPDSHSLEAERAKDRQQEHQESIEKQTQAIGRNKEMSGFDSLFVFIWETKRQNVNLYVYFMRIVNF